MACLPWRDMSAADQRDAAGQFRARQWMPKT
jgi:hypothetical protein